MKRGVWIAIAVILVAAGGYLGYGRIRADAQSSSTKPQTALVSRGDLQATVSSSGSLKAARTSSLGFGASGTVTSLTAAVGQTVKAGDVLATLDDSGLQAQVTSAELAQLKLDDLKAPPTDAEPCGGPDHCGQRTGVL